VKEEVKGCALYAGLNKVDTDWFNRNEVTVNPNAHWSAHYRYTHERDGFAKAGLTQQHGDKMRPSAYYSTKLDPVAQGLSPCLRAVAAASYAV